MAIPLSSEDREPPIPGELRFQLAVQRSRALVYLTSLLVALPFKWLGVLEITYLEVFGYSGAAIISAMVAHWLYKARYFRHWKIRPEILWMPLDIVLISVGVAKTGGGSSPWFIAYLTNLSAAAFVADLRVASLVATGNILSYLAVLVWLGEIHGLDASLYVPLFRILFLHAATSFFLSGVANLKEKRRVIQRLQTDQTAKVQELTQLTTELEEASSRARAADRTKSAFLASMSHELRTPMNSIIGFTRILIPRLESRIEPRELHFLRNVRDSGDHLLHLINNLLDLSKIEAGKMEVHLEETRIATVIHGVCTVMKGFAAQRSVEIEPRLDPELDRIRVDVPKLKQILFNLLSNAVKYSPEGGRVELEVERVLPDASRLGKESYELAVRDHGPGIATEDQELIFQAFRQVGESRDLPAGTGLGLAIVNRFVDLLEGEIGVESSPGEGATFRVLLPRGNHTADSPDEDPERVLEPGRHRVLVVEDDSESFAAIADSFDSEGLTVVWARSGEEALHKAKEARPSVIVLDLMLPDRGGWSVFQTLKSHSDTSQVPIVIVSVLDNRELGFSLGVDDYFIKPVVPQELVAAVRKLAEHRREGPILVIDDERATRELLEQTLGQVGLEVITAKSGEEGLELAVVGEPAAIVLDLMMPDLSGFETACRLQQDARTAEIPVLVLTARDLDEADRRRLSGRVSAILQKGDAPGELLGTIERLLARQGKE